MIARALQCFPELADAMITVGYTRKHLGSATVVYQKKLVARLIIRLRIRKLTFQTIGHELTHLIQGLARGRRSNARERERIPSGEKQCDIWTLARDPLFGDDPPTYLKVPRLVREQWPDYAARVRALCRAAIERRPSHRFYIRWLENEIAELARQKPARPERSAGTQLELPFSMSYEQN